MAQDRADKFVSDGSDFTILSSERSCLKCKHKTPGKHSCSAFPRRIPKEILRGGECQGDNGVRFEEEVAE